METPPGQYTIFNAFYNRNISDIRFRKIIQNHGKLASVAVKQFLLKNQSLLSRHYIFKELI